MMVYRQAANYMLVPGTTWQAPNEDAHDNKVRHPILLISVNLECNRQPSSLSSINNGLCRVGDTYFFAIGPSAFERHALVSIRDNNYRPCEQQSYTTINIIVLLFLLYTLRQYIRSRMRCVRVQPFHTIRPKSHKNKIMSPYVSKRNVLPSPSTSVGSKLSTIQFDMKR